MAQLRLERPRQRRRSGGFPASAMLVLAIVLALLSLTIIYFSFCAGNNKQEPVSEKIVTDGAGNRANGCDAVADEINIYFSNRSSDGKSGTICAFDKATGEITELCRSGGRYLLLSGERIIFSEYSSDCLYSVSTSGEGLMLIRSGSTVYSLLKGGYIYYADHSSDDPHIGRMKPDGTGDEVLLKGWYDGLTSIGDRLYFTDADNGSSLCGMPLSGGEKEMLLSLPVDDLQAQNGTLYFYDMGGGSICSYKPGDGQATVVYANRSVDCMNVFGKKIFYHDNSLKGIYSVGINGSDETLRVSCDAASITITDGYIFYNDRSTGNVEQIPIDAPAPVEEQAAAENQTDPT